MKVFNKEINEIVRISFGSKSMSFSDTTIDEVYNVFLKTFADCKVTKTIVLRGASVFEKPITGTSIVVNVRYEGKVHKKSGYKGKSMNKTIYGLTSEEALHYFKENFEKFI